MAKRLMWALWPSFLVAAGATGVFFSVFDPLELHWFGQIGLLSRQASYTLGFFFFWLLCAFSAALALWLSGTSPALPPG